MPAQIKNEKKKKEGKNTRDRIVQAAAELIYRHGFNATSLDMVCEAAGANRGSLYYFFRSKKNLALSVIEYFSELLRLNYLDPAFSGNETGREKVARFSDLYSHMPDPVSPCCGCPIGNLSLELSGLDEELRERLKEVWLEIIGRIASALRQAQTEGDLAPNSEPEALARSFFQRIQGAHIIARSTLDEETLQRDCRDAFERLPWVI